MEILDKIVGKSYKLLSEEYGVGISDIKRKGTELKRLQKKDGRNGLQKTS